MQSKNNNKMQIFTAIDKVTILAGTAVGLGVGLLFAGVNEATSLGSSIFSVALPAIAFCMASIVFSARRVSLRKKAIYEKLIAEPAPKQMLSASKDHPLISTLVYNNSINDLSSETLDQNKMLANAEHILASMDHTTVSMH
mgnify:CR=1 FL=1